MNFRQITDRVFYTGVNDRVTELFENLWPIPNGVSYNAYIVKGSLGTALIDTVRIDEVREFMNNLESVDAHPDYLVINHMEPDHSGSIPEVLRRWPKLKIVGNAITIKMIRGFYHIEDTERFHEVKDGDILDLGDVSLKFVMTPMVHWPETMMTYLVEDSLVFSGDAFGTFGALNGGVMDTEMDTDWYLPEMRRYYYNIVAKYSKFVQRALLRLQELPVNFICPTHGPVWHERAQEIIGLYDAMSKGENTPGATIIYGSMYGNTAEMAETVARELCANGIKTIKIHNASTTPMSTMIADACRYSILIIGSATYSMRLFPSVETFLQALETREIGPQKIFAAFGSFAWAKGAVLKSITSYAERMKMPVVATASMEMSLEENSTSAACALAHSVVEKLRSEKI